MWCFMRPLFEHAGRVVDFVSTDFGKPAHFICVCVENGRRVDVALCKLKQKALALPIVKGGRAMNVANCCMTS